MSRSLNGIQITSDARDLELLGLMGSAPHGIFVSDDERRRGGAIVPAPVDKLELYRWAVQDPETHAILLRTIYEQLRPGRQPIVLREDFAGTSAESVAWVFLQHGHRAIAVDLDGTTLEWARRRAVRLLGPLASEIEFVQADGRSAGPPKLPHGDITSVLNYSILYLREPEELVSYLRNAFNALASDGILVLNLFGGAAAVRPGTTRHRVTPSPRLSTERTHPAFDYLWEVRSYEAKSQRLDCRIHFAIPDSTTLGTTTELHDAFRYEWRLWSVHELLDACAEAGFSDVQVWRHTHEPSKGAAAVFLGCVEPDALSAFEKWSAYIVACR